MSDTATLWGTAALTIAAIIAAPITALWVQRKGDERQALRKRREEIFRALWINRARPVYLARVDALNMIDVEFYGQKKVIEAWADLLAHYNTNYQAQGTSSAEMGRIHAEKNTLLLYEMSQVLGYEFGKTHIRDNAYRPVLHDQYETADMEVKTLTRDILKHLRDLDALPVSFTAKPENDEQDPFSLPNLLPPTS